MKSANAPNAGGTTAYPAAFLQAVERVLQDEGGYSAARGDRGGETRYGISHREYPELRIAELSREQAIAIYFRDWWQRYQYAALPSETGAKLFDLAVNMGNESAVRCLQRALRACGNAVAEDGGLGSETLAGAGGANPAALKAALRAEAAGHYRLIASSEAAGRFLAGWLKRAYE